MGENREKAGDSWAEKAMKNMATEGGEGGTGVGITVSNKGLGGLRGGDGGGLGFRGRAASLNGRKVGGLPNPFMGLASPAVILDDQGEGGKANMSGKSVFAALRDEVAPQSPILSGKRGRESPNSMEGGSPTLKGKSAKIARVFDDSQNALAEGKYVLGEKIDKMVKGLEAMKGIKSKIDADRDMPEYLKSFMAVQLDLNIEAIEGFKTLSNAIEGWGTCMTKIDSNFKDLNQDICTREEQVNQVRDKMKSVDDKENQKKVIEELRKADMTLKIVQLKVDIQTDSKGDTLNEGAKAALKLCKNPSKVKNQLKKVVVLPAANKSYKLDSGHHVDLKVICKSREDRFSLDKELKSEGLRTGYHWPSAIFKQIKEIRQKYLNLGMIDINEENIDMGKIDLLIRPTRSCERLVVKMRPKGHGKFEFLETIGMPFTDDLSICKSNFW